MQLINPHNVRRHKGRKYSDFICTTHTKKNSKLMMNHRRKIDELSSALSLKFTEKKMDFIIRFSILSVKTKYFIYVDSFKSNLEISEFDH